MPQTVATLIAQALAAAGITHAFAVPGESYLPLLDAMRDVFGADRAAVVARELTKTFEEFRRAPLAELAAHYAEAGAPKGEVVICVAQPAAAAEDQALKAAIAGPQRSAQRRPHPRDVRREALKTARAAAGAHPVRDS